MLHVWMQFIERTAHMNLKRTVSADEFFQDLLTVFWGSAFAKMVTAPVPAQVPRSGV